MEEGSWELVTDKVQVRGQICRTVFCLTPLPQIFCALDVSFKGASPWSCFGNTLKQMLSQAYHHHGWCHPGLTWGQVLNGNPQYLPVNNLSTTTRETGSAPALMATNQNWWGRYKGKSLAPWSITCMCITDLTEHSIRYFQGHGESEGVLKFVIFCLLIFIFACLSSLSSTKSVSYP